MFWGWGLLILGLAGLGGGCTTPSKVHAESSLPGTIHTLKDSKGSLWDSKVSQNFLFQDIKAGRVNDIVTVRIIENSSGSKNASTETKRDTSFTNEIQALLGVPTNAIFGSRGDVQHLDLDTNTSTSFEGEGGTRRSSQLSASITARVKGVLPNGDLAIEGKREVVVNSERQFIILRGIVRPQDIGPNNTVLSTYVADAKIEYTGRGLVSENQGPGWLFRLLTWIWPF